MVLDIRLMITQFNKQEKWNNCSSLSNSFSKEGIQNQNIGKLFSIEHEMNNCTFLYKYHVEIIINSYIFIW